MEHSFCTGCGKDRAQCSGCQPNDPPHFCPVCGAWMAVRVTPTEWIASCRTHGVVDEGTGVSTDGLLDTH